MTPPAAASQSTSQEKRTRRFCFPMRPLSTMNRRPNQSKIMIFSLCLLLYRQLSVYRQSSVYHQSSVYRQQSLIRDANSEHALTDLRLFLYVKERPEVTILSWGKGRKDLTYTPKIADLLPYFDTNSSTRYNFLDLELESFAAAHKNSFNIT